MSWFEILRRALELIKALLKKLGVKEPESGITKTRADIVRENKRKQDELIKHHKELYRKNHPDGEK